MDHNTIFDKVVSKELSVDIVFENEHVLAFSDINPQAPVHVLVIPKKKIARVADALHESVEDMGHFFLGVSQTAHALGLDERGYRVVINNGEDARQTVEYLHAHILGGRNLKWPPG